MWVGLHSEWGRSDYSLSPENRLVRMNSTLRRLQRVQGSIRKEEPIGVGNDLSRFDALVKCSGVV